MTTIALVRHGQTDWNASERLQGSSDIPLNDFGREQARRTVEALPPGKWDLVVSSPLGRAAETADIIAAGLGMTVAERLPDLIERGYGEAEGITLEQAKAKWPGAGPGESLFPGQESEEVVTQRGLRAINELAAAHPGKRILAVSHGTLIRVTISELLGHPVDHILNAALSQIHEEVLPDGRAGWAVSIVNNVPVESVVG
jgi:uncharacterized phosphatase